MVGRVELREQPKLVPFGLVLLLFVDSTIGRRPLRVLGPGLTIRSSGAQKPRVGLKPFAKVFAKVIYTFEKAVKST